MLFGWEDLDAQGGIDAWHDLYLVIYRKEHWDIKPHRAGVDAISARGARNGVFEMLGNVGKESALLIGEGIAAGEGAQVVGYL